MKQPSRRPPLPSLDTVIDDSSSLVDYLYGTPYGEEDETLLEHVRVQDLSWHAQWRVWLRKPSRSRENTLPLILAQLQASLLQDSSSLISIWNDEQDVEWKQDEMLRNWKIVRYFVKKDAEGLALNRQDQLDVQRIMQGIDQLVGCQDDEKRKSPREVLHDYYDSSKAQTKDDCCAARPSMKFCSWVASQRSHNHGDEAKRLLEVVEQVPQWRVRRAIGNMPKDLLKDACRHRSSGDFCRGRALLASILMNANIVYPAMTPVPSISSASNILSLIQNYLHPSNEMPNVHGLVLALWDFHLNERDILESIRAFASWFPVELIMVRYRTILTNVNGSVRQVLRATDMVCALIRDETEEWKEVWDDALCRNTLLPLVHAVVLNQDEEALRKCAHVGAALERVLYHTANVVVTACPQLGWIAFLLSDLPVQDDITRTIVEQLGQLYARVSAALTTQRRDERINLVILPPLSIYMDSVLNAASRHSGSAHLWERHIVRTLTLYKECDNVATEWIRCLSIYCKNEEPTTPLNESLHRRVCLSLWGPNTQLVPSVSLPQLLTQKQCAARILLWTPPECLFAHQSNVVVSLEQILSVYGTSIHLCHIVVGIALCAPNIPAACRHVLYQHLWDIVVNGDYAFIKRVERELLPFPTSLEWWKELYADLVRNEVPVFVVKSEPSEFDANLVDDILSKRRKRQREEEGGRKEDQNESLTTKVRSRGSATTVLRKLWGNTEHTVEKQSTNDKAINDAEFPCLENDDSSSSLKDDDDYFDNEEDDRILLL